VAVKVEAMAVWMKIRWDKRVSFVLY